MNPIPVTKSCHLTDRADIRHLLFSSTGRRYLGWWWPVSTEFSAGKRSVRANARVQLWWVRNHLVTHVTALSLLVLFPFLGNFHYSFQLKAKAGSIWKISLPLLLMAPYFSVWILVVQRCWWEEWTNTSWDPGVSQMHFKVSSLWKKLQPSS